MPLPDSKAEAERLVAAMKAWADRHPFAAAELFRSPQEYVEGADCARKDIENYLSRLSRSEIEDAFAFADAEDAREKAIKHEALT